MNVLIATAFLNCLTGSELWVFDVARGLRRRGHDVTCWVKDLAPTAPLPRLLAAEGVDVSDELPPESAVDVAVFQLKETFPTFAERFLDVPRFAVSHGPKLPEETAPADLPPATHVALTVESLAHLRALGHRDVAYTGYGIDLERFRPNDPLPSTPRRAVLHSKYADKEVVHEACGRLGIEVTEVGVGSWSVGPKWDHYSKIVQVGEDGTVVDLDPKVAAWHIERLLEPADLVFGMGRSAVEALAMGKACFVYGYGCVGDGLVTTDRLAALSAVNFSGRVRQRPFTVDAMARELELYDPALGEAGTSFCRELYDLERFLDRFEALLTGERERSPRTLTAELARALALGRATAGTADDASPTQERTELESDLREAHTRLRTQRAELARAQEAHAAAAAEARRARTLADGLMSSVSWRLTAPLRAVKRWAAHFVSARRGS